MMWMLSASSARRCSLVEVGTPACGGESRVAFNVVDMVCRPARPDLNSHSKKKARERPGPSVFSPSRKWRSLDVHPARPVRGDSEVLIQQQAHPRAAGA